MSNKSHYLEKICDMVRTQCHAAYPALDLHFMIHPAGQLAERMELAAEMTSRHKAGDGARTILEKKPMMDRSSVLGIAMKTHSAFFGLGTRDHFLALLNINTDDVEDSRQGRQMIYHLAWHAIDLMHYRLNPQVRERFQDGPMVPKRSPLGMALANLKADIFAAAMDTMQGNKNALKELAQGRATQSITPYRSHRVEDYPYVIAAEATQYALNDLQKRGAPNQQQMIKQAYRLAHDIGSKFEENQIKQWQTFASPAQNMAWAGHGGEEILGAAVNTSENPYIRSIGYLVAEFTGITPLSASTMMSRYNSFTSFERNERLHKERMEDIFEAALSKGLHFENSSFFSDAANQQNEQLVEGVVLGWCADALQEAGETFSSSLPIGKEKAADLARHKFNDQKERSKWEDISKLGEKIIDEKRNGYAVTMGHVMQLCDDAPALNGIVNSLKQTLNDPAYARKLEAANDMTYAPAMAPAMAAPHAGPRGPAPAAAAPVMSGPVVSGPAMAAPSGPSLGGAGSSQMVRARMLIQQKRLAEQQQQENKE